MQTFIEFIKELDPNFTLEEGDCDPCEKGDDKKKDKKGKNPFFAKKGKGDDKEDKKGKNPFVKKNKDSKEED